MAFLLTTDDVTTSEPEAIIKNVHEHFLPAIINNKENKELNTPIRRRRDRYSRQAHIITQQQEMLNNSSLYNSIFSNGKYNNNNSSSNCNGSYTNLNGSYTTNSSNVNSNGICNRSYNYNNHNGHTNGVSHCNGVNGHKDEEESFVNRAANSINIADVIKNGLCVF